MKTIPRIGRGPAVGIDFINEWLTIAAEEDRRWKRFGGREITDCSGGGLELFICGDCGGQSLHSPETVEHNASCKPGEGFKWVRYYSEPEETYEPYERGQRPQRSIRRVDRPGGQGARRLLR